HGVEQRARVARPRVALGDARDPQREAQLVHAREGRQEVPGLEDEADALAPQPRALTLVGRAEVDALEAHRAGLGRGERTRDREQARLAGAGRPDDRDELARGHAQAHLVERDDRGVAVAVPQGHPVDLEDRGVGGRGAHRCPPRAVRGSTEVTRATATAAPAIPSTNSRAPASTRSAAWSANGIGEADRPAPAAMPRPKPTAIDPRRSTAAWPRLSARRKRRRAPMARMTAISWRRWIVHTVKNAPTTSAEIA